MELEASDQGSYGPGGPTGGSGEPIRLRYVATRADQLRAGAFGARRSDTTFAFGLLGLVGAAILGWYGDLIGALVALAIGVGCLTGWIAIPLVWLSMRASVVVGSEIEDVIDDTGILERSPKIEAHVDWSVYRDVTETPGAFYLAGPVGMGSLPKRAFSEPDLAAFRALITRKGLWRRPRRLRRLLTVVVVSVVIVGIALAPVVITRLLASPRLEVAPRVDGETITVRATTDLPDGAIVTLEIIQLDEYSRSIAAGGVASTESPWVEYEVVSVLGGAAEATFAPAWPAGRHRAIVFFEPSIQPAHVLDRYGARGERITRPTELDEDGNPFVKVAVEFDR